MKSDGTWYTVDKQDNDVEFYLLNKGNKVEIYNQDEVLIGEVDGNWDESDEDCGDGRLFCGCRLSRNMAFDIENVVNNYLGLHFI